MFMRRSPRPSITSAPLPPDQERVRRMVNYAVAMGIRVLCILAVFVVPDWWKLLPAAAAVILPYTAVIAANAPRTTGRGAQLTTPGVELSGGAHHGRA